MDVDRRFAAMDPPWARVIESSVLWLLWMLVGLVPLYLMVMAVLLGGIAVSGFDAPSTTAQNVGVFVAMGAVFLVSGFIYFTIGWRRGRSEALLHPPYPWWAPPLIAAGPAMMAAGFLMAWHPGVMAVVGAQLTTLLAGAFRARKRVMQESDSACDAPGLPI